MREDMAQLLVERPRRGGYGKRRKRRKGRDLDGPAVQSMRAPHRANRKDLNENLSPLRRWFYRQVGRPWDKVYSELRERVDVRGATQLHILQHAEMYVETNTAVIDGRVVVIDEGSGRHREPGGLYVHPKTKVLATTPLRSYKRRALDDDRVVPRGREVYGRKNGEWFRLELKPMPMDFVTVRLGASEARTYTAVHDVFLGKDVRLVYQGNRDSTWESCPDTRRYSGGHVYYYCTGMHPLPKARAKAMGLD